MLRTLVVLTLATAATSFAQDAVAKKVELMLELTNVKALMEQNISQVETAIKKGLRSSPQYSPAREPSLSKVEAAMFAKLREALSWDALKPELTKIYAETLTEAELDAAIKFYQSPEGASLTKKLPELSRKGAEVGEKRFQSIAASLQEDMMKAMQPEPASDPLAPPPPAPKAPKSK